MDSNNVSRSQPWTAGAIFVDLAGTATLPTDATSALTGFTELGYVSEDGVTWSRDGDSNDTNAWGGALVDHSTGNKTTTFELTLIEHNEDVFKLVFNPSNVTSGADGQTTITDKGWNDSSYKMVIDTVLKDGTRKRHCIHKAIISGIGDESMNNSDLDGFDLTFTCMAASDGSFQKIHYNKPTTPSSGN